MHKIPDTKYLYNYNKTLTCIYLYEADLFKRRSLTIHRKMKSLVPLRLK